MKRLLTLWMIGCLAVLSVSASRTMPVQPVGNPSSDALQLQQLKANYRALLIPVYAPDDTLLQDLLRIEPETEVGDQMVVELMNRYPIDTAAVSQYLRLLTPEGAFTDIDYKDQGRSGWRPKLHAERMLQLCKLYATSTSPYYHSKHLMDMIHRLMGYWFRVKPMCPNWWYNQIGIPRTMGQAFLIIEDQLTKDEKAAAIALMQSARIGMTGQNKVWLAGNVLMRGLLADDVRLVQTARDTILAAIYVSDEEGIRPDWSYHLHGPQLQFGNYGLAFLSGMSFYYRLFQGTSFAMEDKQREILIRLVDEGYRWVVWHREMDLSAIGRQLFRRGALHKGYCLAFAAQDLGLAGFPLNGNPLVGHKHFPYSDYTAHRMKTWMASVKMSSLRTIGSEHVNEDNVFGYYMGDGATCFLLDRVDYMDALPLWDWRKVPGTTAYDDRYPMLMGGNPERNNTQKVGGISEGLYGMSAMEYRRDGIRAYKSWVFTPEAVVCLGAGISSDSLLHVTTSIDQRPAEGPLLALRRGKWHPVTDRTAFAEADRFYHNHVGYVSLQRQEVMAEQTTRTGSWSNHMRMYKPAEVAGEISMLYIDHGSRPQRAGYAYVVLPDVSAEQVCRFSRSDIRIVRNDAAGQILTGKMLRGRYWAVFYQPATTVVDGISLTISTPGIYSLKREGKAFEICSAYCFPSE